MSYNTIMQYASTKMIERLASIIKETDIELYAPLPKADCLQLIYNHLLQIALHAGDIDKAALAIYNAHASVHGEGNLIYKNVMQRVKNTAQNYPYEVEVMNKLYECYLLDAPDAVLMAFLDKKLK